jgi:hypothetical protein
MLFGATPFSNSPFADPGGVSIFVTVSGQRMNFAIGNVVIEGKSVVLPTGQRVDLATGDVVIKIGQTVLVTGQELALATDTGRCDIMEPYNSRSNWCLDSNRSK